MTRQRIANYVIGLACFCSVLLCGAVQAKAKPTPKDDTSLPTCPKVDKQSREMANNCTVPDPNHAPPSIQPPPKDGSDKDLSPFNDRMKISQDDAPKGHFDAKGGTGLIPVGRVGWREIGSWREMHRVRGNRQVP